MSTYGVILRNMEHTSAYRISLRSFNHMLTYETTLRIINPCVNIWNQFAQYDPYVDIRNNSAHCKHKKQHCTYVDIESSKTGYVIHDYLEKNLNALYKFVSKCKFMNRMKMGNIPVVFHEATKKLNHKYSSTFSNLHCNIEKCS